MKLLLYVLTVIVPLGAANSDGLSYPDIPPNRKIDSYGDISFRDEKARLDAFAVELKKVPHYQGYIMLYAGKLARRGEARRQGERARAYLINKWGMHEKVVVAVDCGYRDSRATELFIVPSGGVPPPAEPTLHPSEVQIIGGRTNGRRGRVKL